MRKRMLVMLPLILCITLDGPLYNSFLRWGPSHKIMKHYCAKPSAQLPKDMHILHCCYKLVDNHLEIVPVCELKVVKAMGITLFLDL